MSENSNGLVPSSGESDEYAYSAGAGLVQVDKIADPGIEPHRVRMTDKSVKHEKAAEKQVATLFVISILGSIFAIFAYFFWPLDGSPDSVRINTTMLGLGITLGLFGIGFGAVHWAKTLMPDAEIAEDRHQTRGSEATRARAVEIIKLADTESGFSRRKLIRRTMYGALALFPLPAIVFFKDMTTTADPVSKLNETLWKEGVHLVEDPSGRRIKAADVTVGAAVHVIPEGLQGDTIASAPDMLEQKAKAAVLLVRLNPDDFQNTDAARKSANWGYDGIVAYSKICTHVGCPVALYEQQTHHLLCPCHQSTFDITNDCAVIFGPASRPLPQLAIDVDAEGYLVARAGFQEPVGPSFWERKKYDTTAEFNSKGSN